MRIIVGAIFRRMIHANHLPPRCVWLMPRRRIPVQHPRRTPGTCWPGSPEEASMLQVQFLGMGPSPAIEDRIRQWSDRLSRYGSDIQNCRVWVERTTGHHRKGALFSVRIRLTVPGEEIAVELQP